jgi:O-antigen/teichoic acid export membrane protein
MLGKVGFGEFGIVQSTIGMLSAFGGFGLGLTATRHVAEFRLTAPSRAGRIIILSSRISWVTGALCAALLFSMADWLATRTLAAPHLASMLRASAAVLLVGAINGAQTGALSGFEAFKTIARINLVAGLTAFPVMVGATWWAGLHGAIWGLIATQGLNCILNHRALVREARRAGVPLCSTGSSREWQILWRFSLPAVLAGVMVGPALWVCNSIIVHQPEGYAEMGLFNAANQWRMAVLFFPGMLASVVLPMLSSLRENIDASDYRSVLKFNLWLSALSASVMALPICLLAPWIMARYGPGFVAGGNVLVILSLSSVIMAALNAVGQTIASDGKMWPGLALNSIWATVLIFSCWVLRHRGAMGLGLANLVAYTVHVATVSWYVRRRLVGKAQSK